MPARFTVVISLPAPRHGAQGPPYLAARIAGQVVVLRPAAAIVDEYTDRQTDIVGGEVTGAGGGW